MFYTANPAIFSNIIFLLLIMKRLRSLLAFFLAGLLTCLLLGNSVLALNSTNLRSPIAPQKPESDRKTIAFQPSSSRQKYLQQLEESDRYFQQGAIANVLKIQKEIKEPFTNTGSGRRKPIDDPALLSGGAGVYYRDGKSGLEQGLTTKALIPLQRLSEDYPEFIPGHLMLAQAARQFSDEDTKAALKKTKLEVELEALERGSSIFPERKDLLDARIQAFATYKKFIEASVTARQFAVLFPDDPDSSKYLKLADEYLDKHRQGIHDRIMGTAALNVISGNIQGLIQIVTLLSQSESDFGTQAADEFKQKNQLVTDPDVLAYLNRVGQKVAKTMGRNEFQYEFNIYKNDDEIDAHTFPGGKIFISTGILNAIGTEAELAGLLGHEAGHAVLSHGYSKMVDKLTEGAVGNFVGIGFLLNSQLAPNTPTEEKQADILGTRAIVSGGYSADGLWTVMRVLKSLQGNGGNVSYLSSHSPSSDRVAYLEEYINRNNFNRYGFEGVSNFSGLQKHLFGDRPSEKNSQASNERSQSSNSSVAAKGCQSGKVPLTARVERDQVTVSLDGAIVANTCTSFTIKVRIKNDSDRTFTFVPGFVQVLNGNGDPLKTNLTFKKGQSSTAQVGEEIEANLQVFKRSWSNDGKQDLTLELKEGSSVARVFRVAF